MYNQKLVASLKANGKILREFKDTVYCPFGAEYSILLKNLNTVRAVVHVFIDGEDMVPNGLVLNAGQECELERSIKNGNLNEGNRFKFIERTGNIEQHRGVKLEDGLIRIEYQFEIPRPIFNIHNISGSTFTNHDSINPKGSAGSFYSQRSALRASGGGQSLSSATYSTTSATVNTSFGSTTNNYVPQNDTGITVPGSKSEQKFSTTYMGALDPQKYSIVLKILGETPDNEPVRKPVTVKTKQKCITCNHTNKISAKFCAECGTSLKIYA